MNGSLEVVLKQEERRLPDREAVDLGLARPPEHRRGKEARGKRDEPVRREAHQRVDALHERRRRPWRERIGVGSHRLAPSVGGDDQPGREEPRERGRRDRRRGRRRAARGRVGEGCALARAPRRRRPRPAAGHGTTSVSRERATSASRRRQSAIGCGVAPGWFIAQMVCTGWRDARSSSEGCRREPQRRRVAARRRRRARRRRAARRRRRDRRGCAPARAAPRPAGSAARRAGGKRSMKSGSSSP